MMTGTLLPPGDEHIAFTKWALQQGVEIGPVDVAKFAGRGLGVVAKRKVEVCI